MLFLGWQLQAWWQWSQYEVFDMHDLTLDVFNKNLQSDKLFSKENTTANY